MPPSFPGYPPLQLPKCHSLTADSESLTNDPSFLTSEIFEIVAESKRFYVHSDFLAAHSEPLRCTTTGVWKEGTERRIDLSDWDDDTVGRFVHFLYTGNYQFPGALGEGGAEGDGVGTPNTVQRSEDQGTRRVDVLLVHARVYALAHYKGVEALRAMALERLRAALARIDRRTLEGDVKVIMGVVELLAYVYSHTDSLTNSEEPMRGLVITFAAENAEKLMAKEGMTWLLRGGGDFGVDLVEGVADRLGFTEGQLCDVNKRLYDMEMEAQMWRDRAAALAQRLRQLEVANAERVRQLEVRIQQAEARIGVESAV